MTGVKKFSPRQAAAARPTFAEDTGEGEVGASPRLVIEHDQNDPRAQALEAIGRPEQSVADPDLDAALAGTTILADPDKRIFVKRMLRNVRESWRQAVANSVQIALELAKAESRLGGEYDKIVGGRLLPFGPTVESQLRTVGRAIMAKRLPADGLPGYSIAYQLAKLPDPALNRAKEIGLVRPDLTRREVQAFYKEALAVNDASSMSDIAKLARERTTLNNRKARLQRELAEVEARLSDIAQIMSHRISAGEVPAK